MFIPGEHGQTQGVGGGLRHKPEPCSSAHKQGVSAKPREENVVLAYTSTHQITGRWGMQKNICSFIFSLLSCHAQRKMAQKLALLAPVSLKPLTSDWRLVKAGLPLLQSVLLLEHSQ